MRTTLAYRTGTIIGVSTLLFGLAVNITACGEDAADGEASQADASRSNVPNEPDPNKPGSFDTSTPSASNDAGSFGECTKMDIVFVVDNSGSMSQEQDNLVANFPKFGSIIDAYKTGSGLPLDYRLAVTTTDYSLTKGAFIKKGPRGCPAGPARPWLERADGTASAFFACRAQVGTAGSSSERALASLLLGLNERIADGTNVDNGNSFLRDDALLAFVAITDEDEVISGNGTSNKLPETIQQYPALFDAVKGGERGRWASAIIAGQTACSSPQLGNAKEAKNLKAFAANVGQNAVFSSICAGDLTEGLTKALDTFNLACKKFPSGPK